MATKKREGYPLIHPAIPAAISIVFAIFCAFIASQYLNTLMHL